jgi:hypothetical protein
MCECNEYKIYEEIVNEYLNKRDSFVKKEWLNFISVIKRMIGQNKEFNRLRNVDLKFYKDFHIWLRGYIIEKKVNLNDEKERKKRQEYIDFLKSHISKMEWRVFFLKNIPIAIITFLFSFFTFFLDKLFYFNYRDYAIFSILIISLILGYSEIQNIADYKSAYKEIIEIIENLDKILQQNDFENKTF